MLGARGLLGCEPDLALDLYTRQSCLRVTARDLAVMGATLANGGVNPISGDPVIDEQLCHYVLAVMITAGMVWLKCSRKCRTTSHPTTP